MSEKRFVFATNEKWFLFDNETEEYMDMEDCKDKLNEQQSKITELEKNFEDLVNWSTEISKRNVLLDEKIGRLQEEEKLYAQEILRLNELLKQYQSFKDLGGDY